MRPFHQIVEETGYPALSRPSSTSEDMSNYQIHSVDLTLLDRAHREAEIQSGISRITYSPRSVGVYSIHVLDKDQNVAGKPIKVDVFDPAMIKLSKIGDVVLGQV